MKIKLLTGIVLGPGREGAVDEVVEVNDHFAHTLIHERRAQAWDESAKTIETRDPVVANRDPQVSRGKR